MEDSHPQHRKGSAMKTCSETIPHERNTAMKRFSILGILLSIFFFTACSTSSTPSGSKPTINSFTASPPNLPAGGGSVTLSWDVKDAKSLAIDNGVGAVTGTSKTVSVTSNKTFTLTATNGGGSTTQTASISVAAGPDTTVPTVISVDPPNGATGVAKDKSIVITFSEKMDQLATQAAYQSADLPASAVTFNWDAEGTTLTIKPNSPLVYASGSSTTIAAKTYALSVSSTAKDVAGNSLAPLSSSFSTLKAISTSFSGEKVRDGTVTQSGFVNTNGTTLVVGDNTANSAMRGFFSFDLTSIPGDAVSIASATITIFKQTLRGAPYTALNPCTNPTLCLPYVAMSLEHVSYGDGLTAEDFNTPSLADLGGIDNTFKPTSGSLSADVTATVQNDLANRAARGNRSQYRLSFPLATNNDSIEDDVSLVTGDSSTNQPRLEVVYLIP